MMGRCSSRRPMLVHHIMFIAMNACFRLNDQTSLRPWSWNGLAAHDRMTSLSRISVDGDGQAGAVLRLWTVQIPSSPEAIVLLVLVICKRAALQQPGLHLRFLHAPLELQTPQVNLLRHRQNAHQRSLDPVPNPVFSTLHSRFGQAHASVDLALDGINSTTWNWMKTLGPALLLLDMAAEEWAKQEQDIDFRRQPCPISLTQSLRVVGKRRMQNVQTELDKAGAVPIRDVSLTKFITALLDAETDQRRIRGLVDLRKTVATSGRVSFSATASKAFLQALDAQRMLQETLAGRVPLFSPSAIPRLDRGNGGCREGLVEIKHALRDAQCCSALTRLQLQVHVKSRLLIYTRQHSHTHSRTLHHHPSQNVNHIPWLPSSAESDTILMHTPFPFIVARFRPSPRIIHQITDMAAAKTAKRPNSMAQAPTRLKEHEASESTMESIRVPPHPPSRSDTSFDEIPRLNTGLQDNPMDWEDDEEDSTLFVPRWSHYIQYRVPPPITDSDPQGKWQKFTWDEEQKEEGFQMYLGQKQPIPTNRIVYDRAHKRCIGLPSDLKYPNKLKNGQKWKKLPGSEWAYLSGTVKAEHRHLIGRVVSIPNTTVIDPEVTENEIHTQRMRMDEGVVRDKGEGQGKTIEGDADKAKAAHSLDCWNVSSAVETDDHPAVLELAILLIIVTHSV
ncbi:hypothetical protein MIND_01433300 [Mycena indigotica]|uniref:Uncharacterized protein n=1 Tax=Mycena indigotica TaxID=2126181 RepID=A0A8H6RXK4_9AGAR|nr:uncharacterized protein MIND_01433300 [Mycena indigotica]KAF7288450.1 hypothetical protein MIND_01433300 [Mycena indigotica]